MLRLITLGNPALLDANAVLPLPPWRQIAVLVLLSSRREPVARHELCRLLWNAPVGRRQLHSLSQTIYSLRKRLPRVIIRSTHSSFLLESGIDVDAARLLDAHRRRDSAEVSALYRGRLLVDFRTPDAPAEWEHWVDRMDQACREAARVAFLDLYETAVDRGDLHAAYDFVRRMRELQLDASEQHADVSYTDARRHAPPASFGNPDTVQLPLGVLPGAIASEFSESGATLLGRDRQVRMVRELLHAPLPGRTIGVLVTGEAGIGKTRFTEYVIRLAALRGWKTLVGRCCAAESATPLSVIRRALARVGDSAIGPEWLERFPGSHYAPSMKLRDALRQFVAENRSILWLDDYHYADPATSEFIESLFEEGDRQRCVIILSYSTEPTYARSVAGCERLVNTIGACRTIVLAELDKEFAIALVQRFARLFETHLTVQDAERIYRTVGGRPLLIREMVRAIRDRPFRDHDSDLRKVAISVPERVRWLIGNRLRLLSEDDRSILRLVAAAEMPVTHALLAAIADLPSLRIADSVSSLIHLGLLKDNGSGVEPAHALISAVVVDAMGRSALQLVHHVLAEGLDRVGAPHAVVARHYDAGCRASLALSHYLRASREALQIGELPSAEMLALSALRLADGSQAVHDACSMVIDILCRLKKYSQAASLGDRFRVACEQLGDRVGLFKCDVLAIYRALADGLEPVGNLLPKARELVGQGVDLLAPMECADLLCTIAELGHDLGDESFMVNFVDDMHAAALRLRDAEATAVALGVCSTASSLHCDSRLAIEIGWEAVRAAEASRSIAALARAYGALGSALLANSDLDEADKYLRHAIRLAEEKSLSVIAAKLYNNLAVVLIDRGEASAAEAVIDGALTKVERHSRLFLLCNRLLCGIERDVPLVGVDLLRQIEVENQAFRAPWVDAVVALGWLHHALWVSDDLTAAAIHAASLEDILRSPGRVGGDRSYFELGVAEFYVRSGRPDGAIERLERCRRSASLSPVGHMRLEAYVLCLHVRRPAGDILSRLRELRDWAESKGALGVIRRADRLARSLRS